MRSVNERLVDIWQSSQPSRTIFPTNRTNVWWRLDASRIFNGNNANKGWAKPIYDNRGEMCVCVVCRSRRMGDSVGWTLDIGPWTMGQYRYFFYEWQLHFTSTLFALQWRWWIVVFYFFMCEILLWLQCDSVLEKNIILNQIEGLTEISFMSFGISSESLLF